MASIRPKVAEARSSRAEAIAHAASCIVDALEELPSDADKHRAMAAASVTEGLDPDALYYHDKAQGMDFGRCCRCGRVFRDTGGPRW